MNFPGTIQSKLKIMTRVWTRIDLNKHCYVKKGSDIIESAWTTQRASRGHGEGEAERMSGYSIATSLIIRLQVGLIAASFGKWTEKGINSVKTSPWAVHDHQAMLGDQPPLLSLAGLRERTCRTSCLESQQLFVFILLLVLWTIIHCFQPIKFMEEVY